MYISFYYAYDDHGKRERNNHIADPFWDVKQGGGHALRFEVQCNIHDAVDDKNPGDDERGIADDCKDKPARYGKSVGNKLYLQVLISARGADGAQVNSPDEEDNDQFLRECDGDPQHISADYLCEHQRNNTDQT
jgi:hypothetical protein